MKNKIIIIILALFSYTGVAISAERDCTNPKKMSEKLLCKVSNINVKGGNNDGQKREPLFKTPKIIQKLNKWSAENKTLIK